MNGIRKQTIEGLCHELAAFEWTDAEISELVFPKLGIITGLQDLIDEMNELRLVDLGDTPPAGDITPGRAGPVTDVDIAFAGIGELHKIICAGRLSSAELIKILLDRIDRLNGHCHAFINVLADDALAAAGSIRPDKSNPLAGIPYAVKDLIDIKNQITTAGSRVFHDNMAKSDADVVSHMKNCHAVCIGKTNLHEFAYGATGANQTYGTAINAYDPSRLAGGSSSGSGAAVAFGLVPAAFGTDTGGSVRVPAALSGLVGLKPTHGLISTRGVVPFCWSADHVGTLTRSVMDAAIMLGAASHTNALHYLDPLSDRIDPIKGLRVGVPTSYYFDHADPEIVDATEQAIDALIGAGAKRVDVDIPDMSHCRTVALTLQMPEALSYHMPWLEDRGHLYGADFRAGLAVGQTLLAEHYVRAKRFVSVYRDEMNARFDNIDLLITPSTPCVAPRVDAVRVDIDGQPEPVGNAVTRFTGFFNMTGHPAISVPSGMHSSGLPMAVQLVGRYFEERTLFSAAQKLEQTGISRIPPPNSLGSG